MKLTKAQRACAAARKHIIRGEQHFADAARLLSDQGFIQAARTIQSASFEVAVAFSMAEALADGAESR